MTDDNLIKKWLTWAQELLEKAVSSGDYEDYRDDPLYFESNRLKQCARELKEALCWKNFKHELPETSGKYLCLMPWGYCVYHYRSDMKKWQIPGTHEFLDYEDDRVVLWRKILEDPK